MKLLRACTYRVIATKGPSPLQGKRVRPNLNEPSVVIRAGPDGYLHDLEVYVLSGKFIGQVVLAPPCKLKQIRPRVCKCSAYSFPHAPGLGKCNESKTEVDAPETIDLDTLFKGGT